MKCFCHPDRDAVGVCSKCGKATCPKCTEDLGTVLLCGGCQRLAQQEAFAQERQVLAVARAAASTAAASSHRRILGSYFVAGALALFMGPVAVTGIYSAPDAPPKVVLPLVCALTTLGAGYFCWSMYFGMPPIWSWWIRLLRTGFARVGCLVGITWPVIVIATSCFLAVPLTIAAYYAPFGGGIYQYRQHCRIARQSPLGRSALAFIAAVAIAGFVAGGLLMPIAGSPRSQPAARLPEFLGTPDARVAAPLAKRGSDRSARPETLSLDRSEFVEEFAGHSLGEAYGVDYRPALAGLGAAFSRARESRIQYSYAKGFPRQGTLEWWIRVENGYAYSDFNLVDRKDEALIFTTDVWGGDVTWPGSAWLTVSRRGEIVFALATVKGQSPPAQILRAPATQFRFDCWHALGISFGSEGQQVMLDGQLVATERGNTQGLGGGGNHQAAVDAPTLGESVSGFWKNNQYEGGFEGIVDRLRASSKQGDWVLSRQPPKT